MVPVKIQCGCGQKYAFDVEPVNGRMSTTVACPICGTDGTAAANDAIAMALSTQAQAAPPAVRTTVAAPPAATSVRPPPFAGARTAPVAQPASIVKLTWYEHVWVALPLGLVLIGGAIGGACGGAAWVINKTVFKKTRNPALRYIWTGLISMATVILWLVIVTVIFVMIRKR
jgi:hypothetical protein